MEQAIEVRAVLLADQPDGQEHIKRMAAELWESTKGTPDPSSVHAIVIAGVKGDSLYVVDPNASNEVKVIDFAEFRTNVNKGIAVACPDCPHMESQVRTI